MHAIMFHHVSYTSNHFLFLSHQQPLHFGAYVLPPQHSLPYTTEIKQILNSVSANKLQGEFVITSGGQIMVQCFKISY